MENNFILPKHGWHVVVTQENQKELSKWRELYNNTLLKIGYIVGMYIGGTKEHNPPDKRDGFGEEITYEQFLKYVMKKEIIGYKLKEEFKHYEKAAKSIAGIERFMGGEYHFIYDSPTYGEIKKAGVLDLWFNPVYEETKTFPKINGYEGIKLNDSTVKYGCAELNIDALRSLIQCSELGSSNRTIHSVISSNGETVTIEQIKQIVEYYK